MSSISHIPNGVQASQPESAVISQSPIASTVIVESEPDDQPAPLVINKYLYPEFMGYEGERYLKSIIKQVVTPAMYDTWLSAVQYQAPGNDLYVGAARMQRDLALLMNLSERTLRWRWEQFKYQELVRMTPAIKEVKQGDGTIKEVPVIIKDFSPLYDLAHRFHEWLHSPAYIAPDRDYADALATKPELVTFLIQFHCYRRILSPVKLGRPRKDRPTYQEELQQMVAARCQQVQQSMQPQVAKLIEMPASASQAVLQERQRIKKEFKKEVAAYPNKDEIFIENRIENTNSKHLEEKGSEDPTELNLPAGAIRNTESGTKEPDQLERNQHDQPSEKNEQEKERGGREAPLPLDDREAVLVKAQQVIDEATAAKPTRLMVVIMDQLIPLLNDDTLPQSTITRVKGHFKKYMVYGEQRIREAMWAAASYTLSQPDNEFKCRHSENHRANRMPYFLKALEKQIRKARARMREEQQEQREAEKQTALAEIEEQQQPPVTVDDQQAQTDAYEYEPTMRVFEERRMNPLLVSAQALHIHLSHEELTLIEQGDPEMLALLKEAVERETFNAEVEHELRAAWSKLAMQARRDLATGERIQARLDQPCAQCGSVVHYSTSQGQLHCVVCEPHPMWSMTTRAEMRKRIASGPTFEEMARLLMQERMQFAPEEPESPAADD